MSEHNPWKRISSKIVYKNPWITVREDQVIQPAGNEGIYGVVEARVATGVVALTPKNEVYLVGQYRYTTDMYSWEIPEGGADIGEEPEAAIKRELREEAGVEADKWQRLGGELHLTNSHSNEKAYLFLAQELREVTSEPDPTEVIKVKKVPLNECIKMIESGEIVDSLTIIGLLQVERMFR